MAAATTKFATFANLQQKCIDGLKWDFTNENLLLFSHFTVYLKKNVHSKCVNFHSKRLNLHSH